MEKTVYIDLLFLVNFSMDFLCFYITSKILSIKMPTVRALLSAALGGAYSCAVLFLPSAKGWSFLIDLAVCFAMCLLVYASGQRGDIFICVILYFAVSMALGGFMTAIFNLLNRLGFSQGVQSTEEGGISVWLFLLIAAISGLFTLLGGRFFKKSSAVGTVLLEVLFEGKRASFSALVDSGNFLSEPISGRPCVVADISVMSNILPSEILSLCKSKSISMIEATPAAYAKSIRLIPTKTATGEGLLVAIRPEKLKINAGGGFYEADAVIAITSLGKGRGALVPVELIK